MTAKTLLDHFSALEDYCPDRKSVPNVLSDCLFGQAD